MKRILLLSSVLLLSIIANAQTPVKKAAKPHAKTGGAKLLVKCNVNGTVMINEVKAGVATANVLVGFTVPAGKNMISIVPADADKYNQLDTIFTIAPNSQDILLANLSEKKLPVADIMNKVLQATSLANADKKYHVILIKLQGKDPIWVGADSSVDNDVYLFPDKAHLLHTPQPIERGDISESTINANTYYTHSTTGPSRNEPWIAVTDRRGKENILCYLYKDIFGEGGDIFATYPEYRVMSTGTEMIDNKSILKIQLEKRDSRPMGTNEADAVYDYSIYIDKDTYLPLKIIYSTQWVNIRTNQPSNRRVECNYSDYKSYGPFLLPSVRSNGPIRIIRISTDVAFDDENALFAVPGSVMWF